jgi:CheY-like chemotaxis protein
VCAPEALSDPKSEIRNPKSEAVLTISDTGMGIEPEMLPRVFETFVQADRSLDRSRGGLGLGLALVKGIVELHHGSVGVDSEGPGSGTSFTIRLPLLSVGDRSVCNPVPTPPQPSEPTGGRILLIEDNADMAETLRELLDLAGYPVEVARTGPEGIARAEQFRPKLVICDIGLPGMDGYQVAAALRRQPATARVPLIALSGYAQEEDLQRSREAGFNSHLKKPVEFSELVSALERLPSQDRSLAGSNRE